MNTFKSINVIVLLLFLLSSCASLKVNQAANTDITLAINAINQLKEVGVVVIFPTEHKKEKALINFAKSNPSIQKDIEKLKSNRKERFDLWQKTKKEYSFSKLSFVPDSLLKSYIADPNNSNQIGKDGELITAPMGNIYVLYTDYGGFEVKQNGQFIPNPFPNKVQPAWGSSIKDFLGVQPEEKSVMRFFTELNSQLSLFYGQTRTDGN